MKFERLNPVTGEVASSAAAMKAGDIPAITAKAQDGFTAWSKLGPNARRAVLNKAADALMAKKDAFVAAMMGEIGATAGWAMFNLGLAAGMVREAAALTTQISGEVIPSDHEGTIAMALREPVGVLLGIAPWNAPIILGVRAIAVPLACGNSVILKASENCPQTHALIDAPEVRRVNFTGSTAVGRIIAKRAAEHLKPVLLELGGKAPMIVLEDADLDEAVKAAAFGAYMNQGQICMSTERIIVVESVADAFAEKFAAKVKSMPVGNPVAGNTPLGAVVDRQTVDKCYALIDDAVGKGAKLLTGGETTENVLMPAHLVDHVTPDMKLFRDESFGPVVGIARARDEAHAIELANDTEYGLSAAVFTKDTARGIKVARQIQSGICHVNASTVSDEPQMPFGGMKASGYGRFGGKAGIDAFTELRWITFETEPGHYPI